MMGPEKQYYIPIFKAISPLVPEKKGFFFNDFTIYMHGSNICHVTKLIFINFHFLLPKSFTMKFGYKMPSGF